MRFTATTQTCARTCTDAASATSWRWPATTGYAPRPGTTRRSTSPRPCSPQSWQHLSAGPGAKGHRYHDWAWVEITVDEAPGRHWLLIRRDARTRTSVALTPPMTPTPPAAPASRPSSKIKGSWQAAAPGGAQRSREGFVVWVRRRGGG